MPRPLPTVALTLTLALTACGGDSTGPQQSLMTNAQAISVSSALFVEVANALASAHFSDGATTGQSALMMPTFTFSGNCELGGTVSGNGSYENNAYDLTYTPNNCKVAAEDNRTFVVNGDPNIHMSWTMPTSSTQNLSYTVVGGFKWDGGTCHLDYSATQNMSTGHGTIKGKMCDFTIDTTF
jgi:hypothetical protein